MLDYLCFKSEIGQNKTGQVEKEWGNFLSAYQKVKLPIKRERDPHPQKNHTHINNTHPHPVVRDKKQHSNQHHQNTAHQHQNHLPVLEEHNMNVEKTNSDKTTSNTTIILNKEPPNKLPLVSHISSESLLTSKQNRRNRGERKKDQIKKKLPEVILTIPKILKKETNVIEYENMRDPIGRLIILRKLEGKNPFCPFDKNFVQEIAKNQNLFSNNQSNNYNEDKFDYYFSRFSKNRLDKLIPYNDSDDDTDLDTFAKANTDISTNFKHFLKKKKEPTRSLLLGN